MGSFVPDNATKVHSIRFQIGLQTTPRPNVTENKINSPDLSEAYWTDSATKLLIDLYPQYREKVADRKIRSQEKMWLPLSEELNSHKYSYTADQCKNKWKALERSFKNKVDNNKQSGRARKNCSYETYVKYSYA